MRFAYMEAIVRRVNSSPKYRKQTATLQGRLDAAKRALKRCNGLYDSLYQSYVDQLMTEQEYAGITALTREISADLLQSVTIYPDGRMDIRLNLADEIESLLETLRRESCTA